MYKIVFYQNKNGESEVENYIMSLRKQVNNKDNRVKLNKIVAYINLLEEKGLELGEPYIKHLEEDIWELRPIRDRILFAHSENNTFLLLTYFMKETQKTPKQEIEKAKRLLKDYKERSEWNGKERINLGRSKS